MNIAAALALAALVRPAAAINPRPTIGELPGSAAERPVPAATVQISPEAMTQAAAALNGISSPSGDDAHVIAALQQAAAANPGDAAARWLPAFQEFAAAMEKGGGPAKMTPSEALLGAARRVSNRGERLLEDLVASTRTGDSAIIEARANDLTLFVKGNSVLMSPQEVDKLKRFAGGAVVTAATLRSHRALLSGEKTGRALNRTRGEPEETPISASAAQPSTPLQKANATTAAPKASDVPAPAQPTRGVNAVSKSAVYIGGAVVLAAMGLGFITTLTGYVTGTIVALSAIYPAVFVGGAWLLRGKGFDAGVKVLASLGVVMAPVTIATLALYLKLPPTDLVRQVVEVTAIVAAASTARAFRFAFLALPAAATALLLAVDLSGAYASLTSAGTMWLVALASTVGLGVTALLDKGPRKVDYARWTYPAALAGLVYSVGALAWQFSAIPAIAVGIVGAALIANGAVKSRTSFTLTGFGAIVAYVASALWPFLANSVAPAFQLGTVGGLIIAAAVVYRKYAARGSEALRRLLARGA